MNKKHVLSCLEDGQEVFIVMAYPKGWKWWAETYYSFTGAMHRINSDSVPQSRDKATSPPRVYKVRREGDKLITLRRVSIRKEMKHDNE